VSIDVELVGGLDSTVEDVEHVALARDEFGRDSVALTGLIGRPIITPYVLSINEACVHGADTSQLGVMIHLVDGNMSPILHNQ